MFHPFMCPLCSFEGVRCQAMQQLMECTKCRDHVQQCTAVPHIACGSILQVDDELVERFFAPLPGEEELQLLSDDGRAKL